MQKKHLVLSILIFLWAHPLNAGEKAVPISVEWDEKVLAEGASTVKSITEIINAAFNVVTTFPPNGDNIFSWSGSRVTLTGKKVVVYLTESTSPTLKAVFESRGDPEITPKNFDGDAWTAVMATKKGEVIISVMLFLDRLFFVHSILGNQDRSDSLVRTIIALAHELYGNVQADLELPFKNGVPAKVFDINQRERSSFQASIDFIGRLQSSDTFAKLPPKVQEDLIEGKKREELSLSRLNKLIGCNGKLAHP